jgi:tetratricopeptide (TPR) repeat protein
MDHPNEMKHLNRSDGLRIGFLILCTFVLYCRAGSFDFLSFDDQLYVYSNPHVMRGLSLDSLRWAMTAQLNGNWHPITIIVQLAVSSIFGINASAYHLLNVALQCVNAALLYLFFRKSTGLAWPAFLIALLWTVHPQRVESVAWVTELKDVLFGTFWFGSMLAYLHYTRCRTAGRMGVVLLLYVLSLMSKPMAVTFPEAMLLLDFWPLRGFDGDRQRLSAGRWWAFRIAEKLPMVVISVADILLQRNHAFGTQQVPMQLRFENALVSYTLYLRDLVSPYHLAVFYPHPFMLVHSGPAIPLLQVILSGVFILLVSILAIACARTRPYLFVGWFWYLGTMLPVIGLTQVGEQQRADRFMYLPSIGILLAVVWLVYDLTGQRKLFRQTAFAVGAVASLALSLLTTEYLGFWRNTDTLFAHVLELQPNNYVALAMAADRLHRDGNLPEALSMGRRAIDASPRSPRAHESYAWALQAMGDLTAAAEQFQIATRLDPDQTAAWDALGCVRALQADSLAAHHDPREMDFRKRAISDFSNAIVADPDNATAWEHKALQLAAMNHIDAAIELFRQAVSILPSDAQAQGDLADALLLTDDLSGAVEHYRAALADGARNPQWETKLAYLVATSPQASAADVQAMIPVAEDACTRTGNREPAPLDAYAACLARVGRFDDATAAAQQAVAQANAAHEPAIAMAIQKHLAMYQRQQPYVAVRETKPAPAPTTQLVDPTASP